MATAPRYNLYRHGFEACAHHVTGRLLAFRRMVYVYVAPDGDMHCNTNRNFIRMPELVLIGCYTFNAQPEMIEDDMLAWLREQSAKDLEQAA